MPTELISVGVFLGLPPRIYRTYSDYSSTE
jgi:hypothetical protein